MSGAGITCVASDLSKSLYFLIILQEHSDVEWKFARTRLWMSYFEESATLPPPFNIMPTPKLLLKMLGLRKKDKLRKMKMKVNENFLSNKS